MSRLLLALLVAPAHAKCQFADVAGARMPRDATHASARRRADDSGTYVHSTGCAGEGDDCVAEMSLALCASNVASLDESDPLYECVTSETILYDVEYMETSVWGDAYVDWGLSHHGVNDLGGKTMLCGHQYDVCRSVVEKQNYGSDCADLHGSCRSALRHLYEMMFKVSPWPGWASAAGAGQVCNNFARKSIRGFFHDQMSNYIDGSILAENDVQHNFGLCRWAQYVNVLSDATSCDPGTVVAMAGELGYEACGVPIWGQDFDVKPKVSVGRPFPCGPNMDGSDLFDEETGQRRDAFSDTQLSVNSTAMEEFFYATNGHALDRPDGEIEYSADATAAAHAIGRVTCPPDGLDSKDEPIDFRLGFFHEMCAGGSQSTYEPTDVYREALADMRDKQCDYVGDEPVAPSDGKKATCRDESSDINVEGGFCGMPTQFLGTVQVGGQHRVPRWVAIFENSAKVTLPPATNQVECDEGVRIYIPWELRDLADEALPTNAALDKFLTIAWDRVDGIDSAWDSCEVGCNIPVSENYLCGGGGLASFDWEKAFCDAGTLLSTYICAADAGGDAAAIEAAGVACAASWSTDCVVPRASPGGVCAADDDCASGSCKGGICCNARGAEDSCTACSYSGGNCLTCADSYKFVAARCVDECDCGAGCASCDCGVCSACDAGYYLDGEKCVTAHPAGDQCASHDQCASGACRGGRCCDLERLEIPEDPMDPSGTPSAAACLDCNSRGLCDVCDAGYTLCGHTESGGSGGGFGMCFPTSAAGSVTRFACGGDADADWSPASPDGYNYCAMAGYCPCSSSGCGYQCLIDQTCWENSISGNGLTDYEPVFYGACDDIGDWVGRDSEDGATCASVAEDPDGRCVESSGEATTVTSGDACKATCGDCPGGSSSPTPRPVAKPSDAPTSKPTPSPPTAKPTPSPPTAGPPDDEAPTTTTNASGGETSESSDGSFFSRAPRAAAIVAAMIASL